MKGEKIYLEIDSKNGTIALNGLDIPRINAVDIHMKAGANTNVVIDMDTDGEEIRAVIKGEIEWLKKTDHGVNVV